MKIFTLGHLLSTRILEYLNKTAFPRQLSSASCMHALHTVSHTVSLCANTSFCFPKLCKNKFAKAAALRGKREKHANIDFLRGGGRQRWCWHGGRIQKQICEFFFMKRNQNAFCDATVAESTVMFCSSTF